MHLQLQEKRKKLNLQDKVAITPFFFFFFFFSLAESKKVAVTFFNFKSVLETTTKKAELCLFSFLFHAEKKQDVNLIIRAKKPNERETHSSKKKSQYCEIKSQLPFFFFFNFCGGNNYLFLYDRSNLPYKLEHVDDNVCDFCTVSDRNHHSEDPPKDRDKGTDGRRRDVALRAIVRHHAFGLSGDLRPKRAEQRAVHPLIAPLLSRPFIRSDNKDGLRLRLRRRRRGDGNHDNQAL